MPELMRRSEDLDEIIASRPGFYERWALWGFLVVLAVLAYSSSQIASWRPADWSGLRDEFTFWLYR